MIFAWDEWNVDHIARHAVMPLGHLCHPRDGTNAGHEEAVPQTPATEMKPRRQKRETFQSLEKLALQLSDIRPLSAAMRRRWESAKKTGAKMRRGRPRKDPKLKARIVPISMDPELLAQTDRFAKSVGITRSKLVAEALRLRMKG